MSKIIRQESAISGIPWRLRNFDRQQSENHTNDQAHEERNDFSFIHARPLQGVDSLRFCSVSASA
jgi:hypothetical protein